MDAPLRTRMVRACMLASVLVVLVPLAAGSPALRTPESAFHQTRRATVAFTIAGGVSRRLSPGSDVPIDVVIENHHDFPLHVSRLTVRLARVDSPRATLRRPCSLGDFAVDQMAGPVSLKIAPNATSSLGDLGFELDSWPHVSMLNRSVDQAGCKGAVVVLSFSGSGSRTD
jgi:hypothetical protein